MATNNNRTVLQTDEQNLINGLTKHASIITSVYIVGKAMQNADLVQTLQRMITAGNTVNTTRATWRAAVGAERNLRLGNQQFLEALKQTLLAMFVTQPDVLADFGLAPRKKAVLTPQAKVAAAAKAKATREARGTKGKKAILQTTGNVTGIIVTPVTTPAATPPAAPAAPAVASPSAPEPAPAPTAPPAAPKA